MWFVVFLFIYLFIFLWCGERGLSVTYRTLEIGSLGHYLPNAAFCISNFFQLTKSETKQILQKASKTAIGCSYHIFNSRNSASWDANKPFYCA